MKAPKFSPTTRKATDVSTSLRLPTMMLHRMMDIMQAQGYNKKQRMRWIAESLELLVQRNDVADLIAEEFILPGTTTQIPIKLSEAQSAQIDSALQKTRQEEQVEKDRSSVLRTAITQRIMAHQRMQLTLKPAIGEQQ
jgi:hypothetical protein